MKQCAFLLVLLFLLVSVPLLSAAGDVNLSIGVGLPPLTFAAEPDVVVVPSGTSYVYMVPDTPGMYFYGGFWYRFHGNRWYRSDIYNGPWAYVGTSIVPRVIIDVPPDYYRHLPRGYHRIHYGDLHKNWRSWDRGRYWNRHDWYKHEVKEHEKWRHAEARRAPGEHYRPGNDGHRHGGDARVTQVDRHMPNIDRHKPQDDNRKRGDDARKKQGHDRGPSASWDPGQGRHVQR